MAMDGYTLALVAIICTFLILGHWHWRRHNKNSPITNWPLVGMLPGLVCNAPRIHDYFTEVLRKGGLTIDFKGPRFTNLNFIMTSDPENLHYILSTNFGNFQKGSAFKKIFEDLGDGLIIAESDSWKAQRKLIHSLFKDTKFQLLLEKTIEHKVEKDLFPILDQVLQQGTEVDMQDLLLRFTFDVICVVLLGFNSNYLSIELPHNLVATAIDEFEDTLFRRHIVPQSIWKLQKWLQIGEERKATSAHKTISDFIYHHISLKRELIKGTSPPGKEAEMEESLYDSLITRFIKEEEKESIGAFKISDGFLRDSVVNLLVAARNTSSAALAWFFWLVATNPSVEHKIREEIKAHFYLKEGEKSSFFSFEKLNKLVYLHAALCETLRLYPPVPFNHRAAVQPDILPNGHHLDKGSEIMFCHYAMGRMKEIWGEDCEEFKPERWISKQGEILHFPSYKFVAFSAGPRYCVGKDMAFMQMKIVATSVIWNYHLQVVEGHPISPSDSIVLRMKHGLKVNVMKTYQ